MAVSSFPLLVALLACLVNVATATRYNYTLSGSALLGSVAVYNPPVGDPNGWSVGPDGITTTAAGATAVFTIHAIGIYAFTNASAGASYTFNVEPHTLASNKDVGPDFTIQLPDIALSTQTFTITNLIAGQQLTIERVDYMDCVNDDLNDCYSAISHLSQTTPLDHLAGPIAGGVTGGVILIVGIILFIYHRRRMARRRAREAARRPLDFSAMQKTSPSSGFMSQRDVEAQHSPRPVSFGGKGVLSSKVSASDGSSTSGEDDLKLDDNVLAFTDADIAKITAGGGRGASKTSPTTSAGSGGSAWKVPPQRPAPSRQPNPKRSSLTWSISSHSDASSR